MRINQITFTRFLAAISIVIFHFGRNAFPFNTSALSGIFDHAGLGVSYFFVLSGFIMVISYAKAIPISVPEFYKNRLGRIYPVYLLAILILLGYRLLVREPIQTAGLALNMLLLQSWVPGQALSFNGPGWSLSVELLFYLLFPVLYNKYYSKHSLRHLLWSIPLFWLCSQVLLGGILYSSLYDSGSNVHRDLLYHFPLVHLNEFVAGNLCGFVFLNMEKTRPGRYDLYVIVLGMAILLLIRFCYMQAYREGLLAVFFVPFLMLLSLNTGWLSRLFCLKPFMLLGEISYAIYILQVPVYMWCNSIFLHFHISNGSLQFYSFLLILIAGSYLSYHAIEVPLRRKIKEWKPVKEQLLLH